MVVVFPNMDSLFQLMNVQSMVNKVSLLLGGDVNPWIDCKFSKMNWEQVNLWSLDALANESSKCLTVKQNGLICVQNYLALIFTISVKFLS